MYIVSKNDSSNKFHAIITAGARAGQFLQDADERPAEGVLRREARLQGGRGAGHRGTPHLRQALQGQGKE